MGDHNPVYLDEEAARAAGFDGIIAPPTMLQAWIMRGLRATLRPGRGPGPGEAGERLAERHPHGPARRGRVHLGGGHQLRPALRAAPGARRRARGAARDRLGLGGEGHRPRRRPLRHHPAEFTDQHGEPVATMLFRILKFKPRPKAAAARGRRHGRPSRSGPVPPSPRTTGSSSTGPRSTSCSSSGAPTAGPSGTRPGRPAPTAAPSSGTRSPPRAGAPSTASWSTTTPRCRPSTTRWWWRWSSWRRAPGWWPTWPASPPRRWPSACRWSPTSRPSTTT